jgi:subtilase-type serine protease
VLSGGGLIINFGMIAGGMGLHGSIGSAGVVLSGGTVRNGSDRDRSALISGTGYGIVAPSSITAPTVVTNFGAIVATGAQGTGIELDDSADNPVTNAGLITGADGTAVAFGGANNLLVVDPGAEREGQDRRRHR